MFCTPVLFSFDQSWLYITCDLIYVIHGNKIIFKIIVIAIVNLQQKWNPRDNYSIGEYDGMFAKPIEYINDIIVIPSRFIYQLSLRRLFTNELKVAKFIFICNVA